ncbi:MAG: molybdate ABC transporter substrate-binding protein [Dehalococcoidia bacterium]|nr:molybdate ABC transporter substrate-binding protein [Dehalococcoidia bacterium]
MSLFKKSIPILAALLMVLAMVGGCGSTATVVSTNTATQTVTATATDTSTQTVTATTTSEATQTVIVTTTATPTQDTTPVNLNVSAASSLQNALTEINAVYKSLNPWVSFTPNYGASGTLQTQIEQGADCDVFLSAAAAQMNNLQDKSLLLDDTRKDLLNNDIVLVVPKGSTLNITGFDDLTRDDVKMICIGDPGFVPAGAYAVEAFNLLGIYDAISSKFNLGENVTSVLNWVAATGPDDGVVGIVYRTDALSNSNVTVIAVGPDEINATIVYPVAILKDCKVVDAAQAYLDFLFSEPAKLIFEKYGFTMAAQ